MKIQIKKDVIVNALSKVEKAIGKSSDKPILNGIYVEANTDTLKFITTGEEQSISVVVPVDETITVNTPGKIVIQKSTIDIIKKLRTDIVTITVDAAFQYLIEAGGSKFNFSGYDATEYPQFTEPTNPPILEFPFDELKLIYDKMGFATSIGDARPILQGIHLNGKDGQLKIVSTNSHILSQKIMAKEITQEVSLTPKAKSLSDALKTFNSSDTISIFTSSTHLIFKSDNTTVCTRVLEGNYPDTDRLVQSDFKTILEVDKSELLYALEQIEIISGGGNQIAATASLDGINLKIVNNIVETGKADINVPLTNIENSLEESAVKFAFNVKYLINLVKATGGNPKICFIDSMRPISIIGTESNGEYKLILPIRTR